MIRRSDVGNRLALAANEELNDRHLLSSKGWRNCHLACAWADQHKGKG
jgi:hypothetical protein